jgi:hypothetical protein
LMMAGKNLPHACGGVPNVGVAELEPFFIFPTPVGVSRPCVSILVYG